jgi:hypothetical protein
MSGQAGVRGADHAHVDPARHILAQAGELAALQHAQQLGLGLPRQLGDLVEEERALVGRAEGPGVLAHRSGEGATRMLEELGPHQVAGEGGAVEGDVGLVLAPRGAVQRLGHELLPRTRLAVEEDIGRQRADQADLAVERLHRRAATDQPVEVGRAERGRGHHFQRQRRLADAQPESGPPDEAPADATATDRVTWRPDEGAIGGGEVLDPDALVHAPEPKVPGGDVRVVGDDHVAVGARAHHQVAVAHGEGPRGPPDHPQPQRHRPGKLDLALHPRWLWIQRCHGPPLELARAG